MNKINTNNTKGVKIKINHDGGVVVINFVHIVYIVYSQASKSSYKNIRTLFISVGHYPTEKTNVAAKRWWLQGILDNLFMF